MSGLCGIWAPAPHRAGLSHAVQSGLDAIAHRGRDGFSILPGRHAVIGHCLFDTGVNGMTVDQDSFGLSFDGRLDNRGDLVGALIPVCGLRRFELEQLHDKVLLLLAYRHFGDAIPTMLRGDFAFAITDPEGDRLLLCRDHFGVRPLFYRQVGDEFHFASEIKALRAMAPGSPLTIREDAMAGFVAGDFRDREPERTFFRGVRRVLPAHWAVIDREGFRQESYWTLDPALPSHRSDNPQRLADLLAQAINRRMPKSEPTGALLSGGLDSSAIVSLIGAGATCAHPSDVSVFSLAFPEGTAPDESRFADAVVDKFGLALTRIDGSRITAFQDLDEIVDEQDQPSPAPNSSTFRYFLRALAQRSGVRIVLHGHGGDEILSYGTRLFVELADEGRLIKLWRALVESQQAFGPPGANFRRLVRAALRRKLRREWDAIRSGPKPGERDQTRVAPNGERRPPEQAFHLGILASPFFLQTLEVIDHEAAAAGLEVRMPYFDVDLVSFCVTVPAEEKWVGGYPRAHIRKALADVLPEVVARRLDKFDFATRLQPSMVHDHVGLVESTLREQAVGLARHADMTDIWDKWRKLRSDPVPDPPAAMEVWRAVMLGRWLRRQKDDAAMSPTTVMVAAE